MTLRHLKIFLSVCESESITKAADKLYISQPAVSKAIKELEDYYGVKLFDRISKQLYLTQSGKKALEYAAHIIKLFDEMESSLLDTDKAGTLNVGSSMTIGTNFMPLYVKNFKKLYPQFQVHVTIDSSNVIESKVQRNELDFGLIEGIAHISDIISQTYMDDELLIICSPKNALCANENIKIERFLQEPFLLREKGSGTRELFDDVLSSLGYSVSPIWESTNTEALINAVISDLGISVLPRLLVKEKLDKGDLIALHIDNLQFKRKFNIIYHKNKYLTNPAKAFIDMCKNT